MTELKPKFTYDLLFKTLFTNYPELLRRLVAHLLAIKFESINQFELRNTEMTPEILGKKFCRLDISMTVNDQDINLEIQVNDEGDYPERALYYWARMYSNALPVSGKYINLPRAISINILDFILFKQKPEYYSEYQALEVTRHTPLTDKLVLQFIELKKLPKEIDKDDLLLSWLALFKADTKEELDRINKLEVPELSEAINAYNTITTSPEYQELERLRHKANHDEAQALYNAEQRGEKRGADIERLKWKNVAKDNKNLNTEISNLNTEISNLNTEITKLKKEIKKLQKN